MDKITGWHILVLEDEPLIAVALEETLADAGCRALCVNRVGPAMLLLEERRFDAAILDLNLDGELSLPVAHALVERGTPFLFMSGYGSTEVEDLFGPAPILRKPFTDGQVFEALRSLV